MLEDDTLMKLAALPSPLPPAPEDEVFTPEQWRTLLSICEVFVPSLADAGDSEILKTSIDALVPDDSNADLSKSYLNETVADNDHFRESVRQRFAQWIPKTPSQGFAFLLSALNTRVGCLVMTGSTTSFHEHSLVTRSQIVTSWATARLGPLRILYSSCEFLTKATWNAGSPSLHAVLGFPKVPKHIERNQSHDFQFLDFTDNPQATVDITADIVIVGSGCGAGVVAAHVSSSLKHLTPKPRIVVLEKGYHWPSSHFPMDLEAAGAHLFESGANVNSDDNSIAVLAGSTWGGGGTVNWSASLQPTYTVRKQWAQNGTVSHFTSQSFQDDLDEVCDRMGACRMNDEKAKSRIPHNRGNEILLEGARRLGLNAEVVPQNTAGKAHLCGRCSFGCAATTKQGPANYWLPVAASNGTEFIQGCFVDKILWDETLPSTKPKRAIGLKCTWISKDRDIKRTLNIKAPRIILSAGTLHSPLLLHRSSLTPSFNRHIGSNLHLHPTLISLVTFPERINPWDGPILTSAVTSLDNLDGQGHGPKIEVMLGTPDISLIGIPFRPQLTVSALSALPTSATDAQTLEAATRSAADFRVRIARFAHSFGIINIQRDHAEAANASRSYVYQDADRPDLVRVKYTPSEKDRAGLLEGAVTSARLAYVMGANVIDVFSPGIPVFERPSASKNPTVISTSEFSKDIIEKDDAEFERWVKEVKSVGPAALRESKLGSAHQMGTCRMAARKEDGVVGPDGKVWGTEGIWVADASVLPSASGVNPMVSTMGVSLGIAREIVKDALKGTKSVS